MLSMPLDTFLLSREAGYAFVSTVGISLCVFLLAERFVVRWVVLEMLRPRIAELATSRSSA